MNDEMIGLRVPLPMSAEQSGIRVVGLGGQPKLRDGKLSPDGRPTYSSGCVLLVDRAGDVRPDKSASVHVVEPAATYVLGEQYVAAGQVWVTPYTAANDRVALSVTVERLVPPKATGTSSREAAS